MTQQTPIETPEQTVARVWSMLARNADERAAVERRIIERELHENDAAFARMRAERARWFL